MALDDDISGMQGTITVPVGSELLIGIGDFHGHFPAFETLMDRLQEQYQIFHDREKLILREGVTLAFTGDYIDRGNSALKIIESLMTLTENNPNQVHTMMGNHELMALLCYDYAKQVELEMYDYCLHGMNGGGAFVREFDDDSDTAMQNYVERMSREGDIGQWMRNLEPCFIANFNGKKIMFVHADVPYKVQTKEGIREFIKRYREHMMMGTLKHGGSGEKYGDKELFGKDSIFWKRRFGENTSMYEIENLIEDLEVDFLVVGHTIQPKIKSYFGKVFDIDVGMVKAMLPEHADTEPAAIVFKKEGIYGFYARRGEEELVRFENGK